MDAKPPLKARLASVWPIGELSGWAGPSGFSSQSTAADVLRGVTLSGRVYIITGGNAGLGRATAAALAAAGARVVIACRDAARGEAAASELDAAAAAAGAGGTVRFMLCDLASFASVRAFAAAFIATGSELHGLVCNGAPLQRACANHVV